MLLFLRVNNLRGRKVLKGTVKGLVSVQITKLGYSFVGGGESPGF
jgi:hypothetical protein